MNTHSFTEPRPCDPCDGWPWVYPSNGYPVGNGRRDPITLEGLNPRDLPRDMAPRYAFLMPYVRTDWARWQFDLDWTLESGPDDAPSSIEIVVPYDYRPGSAPSYWHPGDAEEIDTGTAWFINDAGERVEVSLTDAETDRIIQHIAENPPEPDYGEDY